MADNNGDFSTVFGADAVIKGEMTFEKSLRLLGRFEGEITNGGELVVSDGATLRGDVKVQSVQIDGQVKGNLDAGQKVELSATARVEGDIQSPRLEVAEGAMLIGRCTVGVDNQASASPSGEKEASAPAEAVSNKGRGNGSARTTAADRRAASLRSR